MASLGNLAALKAVASQDNKVSSQSDCRLILIISLVLLPLLRCCDSILIDSRITQRSILVLARQRPVDAQRRRSRRCLSRQTFSESLGSAFDLYSWTGCDFISVGVSRQRQIALILLLIFSRTMPCVADNKN